MPHDAFAAWHRTGHHLHAGGGRRAGQHTGLQDLTTDQRGRLRLAETNGQVEPIGHQVARTFPDGELNLQLRIDRKQLVQVRRENELAKSSVRVDPQPPAH